MTRNASQEMIATRPIVRHRRLNKMASGAETAAEIAVAVGMTSMANSFQQASASATAAVNRDSGSALGAEDLQQAEDDHPEAQGLHMLSREPDEEQDAENDRQPGRSFPWLSDIEIKPGHAEEGEARRRERERITGHEGRGQTECEPDGRGQPADRPMATQVKSAERRRSSSSSRCPGGAPGESPKRRKTRQPAVQPQTQLPGPTSSQEPKSGWSMPVGGHVPVKGHLASDRLIMRHQRQEQEHTDRRGREDAPHVCA